MVPVNRTPSLRFNATKDSVRTLPVMGGASFDPLADDGRQRRSGLMNFVSLTCAQAWYEKHMGRLELLWRVVGPVFFLDGLPVEWTMQTIVSIHKVGDQLDPSNYRTIMIGHTLAKLYGAVLEAELSSYAEHEGLRAPGQAGFRRAFSTIDHIFTLRCLIDQARTRKKRLYCCFVDFRKAFDTVPRERLFQRLQSLRVPSEMMWGIYALYEQVFGRVRCPGGISDTIASTIGVKQGCPLSPTLFGLYIDEIADFLTRDGGGAVDLSGTPVHIMLYADDIVLVSESQGGLQRHL